MRQTDYAKIADVYDEAPFRKGWLDADLIRHVRDNQHRELRVLDVGCGTGNWLSVQVAGHERDAVSWFGLDASEAMLDRARRKVPSATFTIGHAERLPWEDDLFDFVSINYAFHHFADKDRALDETRRVLRPDGIVKMTNACPEHMGGWWIYRFFPHAVAVDDERFWTVAQLIDAFEERGFAAKTRVKVSYRKVPVADLVDHAELRDVSQLSVLTDREFETGMARLRAHPAPVLDIFAMLQLTARRRPAG